MYFKRDWLRTATLAQRLRYLHLLYFKRDWLRTATKHLFNPHMAELYFKRDWLRTATFHHARASSLLLYFKRDWLRTATRRQRHDSHGKLYFKRDWLRTATRYDNTNIHTVIVSIGREDILAGMDIEELKKSVGNLMFKLKQSWRQVAFMTVSSAGMDINKRYVASRLRAAVS